MRKTFVFVSLTAICIACFWGKIAPWLYAILPMKCQTPQMVYARIGNLLHPSDKDYQIVQRYLEKGYRTELAPLDGKKVHGTKPLLIGKKEDQRPLMTILHVNNPDCRKENCLIVYSSFNKNFAAGLKQLVEHVEKSDFRGDILYRLGGWPNTEGGDLKLAHVPYAFKVCFFREAQRLGYKRALWLDASVTPLVSLNQIFADIEKKGYFVMGNGHKVGPFFNASAAKSLGVSLEESFDIQSCSAGLFGVDFSNEKASKAIELLHAAAHDRYAFFSERWDQNALSVILYKLGMQEMAPPETLAHNKDQIDSRSLFYIDRAFVQKWKK